MTDLRLAFETLLAPEEDDAPPGPRSRRDWFADWALFLVAVGLGSVSLGSSIQHGLSGPLLVVDVVGGILACGALWWRRRWPFELALACAAIATVSSSAGVAALVMLFTVAAYRRWQQAVVVAGLMLVLSPVDRLVHPQGNSLAAYYIACLVVVAGVLVWGEYLGGRRQAKRERQRRAEAEQLLHLEQVRNAERERIAREMHDVLAHRISLLSLHAGALEYRPDAPPEEIARAAAVIRASAHQALEDLRVVLGTLRDGDDAGTPQPPQPTLAALPGLLEESRAAGMDLRAEIDVADLDEVPQAAGRHALRIVQEALTNARKHATSAPVELRVAGAPGAGLAIEVRNPTPVLAGGVPAIPGAGSGLLGLAERVALAGGQLEHGLDEQGDFHLRAWLPWPG
jgi:signal transduction histidine kinase